MMRSQRQQLPTAPWIERPLSENSNIDSNAELPVCISARIKDEKLKEDE